MMISSAILMMSVQFANAEDSIDLNNMNAFSQNSHDSLVGLLGPCWYFFVVKNTW